MSTATMTIDPGNPTAAMKLRRGKGRRLLPGFGLTMGFTLFYLSVIVLLPLAALAIKAAPIPAQRWIDVLFSGRGLAAFRLSLGTSFLAALINAIFGLIVAWVIVRYRFPGRRLLDGLVDLPFALPTAVAGIALTTIYAPSGWLGNWLSSVGISVAYTPLGILVALVFVGLPFCVRTVQPVLEDLDAEIEEAAASLGANRWQTFRRVLFPALFPPVLTGLAMAFARALGEYGSVVFISGNMPGKTEIVPLLIMTRLEEFDYAAATVISSAMLALSFAMLLTINQLQSWSRRAGSN